MGKGISVIFIFLLLPWCQQVAAARYVQEHAGVSPVLFSKKLKELAHGLWDDMGNEKRPPLALSGNDDNALALRKRFDCDIEGSVLSAPGELHRPALPREKKPLLINGS